MSTFNQGSEIAEGSQGGTDASTSSFNGPSGSESDGTTGKAIS
jgi:hypothetical protein